MTKIILEKRAKQFAANLRQWRNKRKLTQLQLAELLGGHHTLISHYERGYRLPRVDMLRMIAKSLGCSMEDLIN